jgi:hypothetical protein
VAIGDFHFRLSLSKVGALHLFYSLLRESEVGCIGALGLSGFLTL